MRKKKIICQKSAECQKFVMDLFLQVQHIIAVIAAINYKLAKTGQNSNVRNQSMPDCLDGNNLLYVKIHKNVDIIFIA